MELLYLMAEKALHVEAKEKDFDIIEDPIDKMLRKEDGWITVNEKNEPIKNINDYISVFKLISFHFSLISFPSISFFSYF
jgi:hypothetical protein